MDFSIIDPHTNAVFQQILSRIRRLQSGGTIDSLQDIGANTDHQIGASYVSPVFKRIAAGKGAQRVAPHHDGFARRRFAEVLHVGGQAKQ